MKVGLVIRPKTLTFDVSFEELYRDWAISEQGLWLLAEATVLNKQANYLGPFITRWYLVIDIPPTSYTMFLLKYGDEFEQLAIA